MRLLAVVLVVAGGAGVLWLAHVYRLWRFRSAVDRREVVLDEAIQQNARGNFALLMRSVRVHQQVLDADAVMPFLSAALRRDLLAVVTEFNNELPKGTK